MGYTRCHTCGRYLPSEAKFCGETCAQRFLPCQTCGGYFPEGQGYSDRYCSPDCAVQYRTIRPNDWRPAGTLAEGML
jgi:predicted nucleic acid-binding Zn ribbon protein